MGTAGLQQIGQGPFRAMQFFGRAFGRASAVRSPAGRTCLLVVAATIAATPSTLPLNGTRGLHEEVDEEMEVGWGYSVAAQ